MLNKIKSLLYDIESEGIEYCNWKSNKKIEQSINGDTDIELLCKRQDVINVQKILINNGYKKFDDVNNAGYSGITNYIGYDEESGKIIHIHLHYELTFGTPFLKEYVSPWSSYIIENRTRDQKYGIWISDPNVETVLLFIRYAMKIRRVNILSRRSNFNDFLDEYEWLRSQIENQKIIKVCTDLLSLKIGKQITHMINHGPKISQFHHLRQLLRNEIGTYSTHGRKTSAILSLTRKGFRGIGKLNEKSIQRPFPSRRKSTMGGLEIAFIGIDGSGKSTQIKKINEWLSWKVDTYEVYFGSGDGSCSLPRLPLKLAHDALNKIKSKSSQAKDKKEIKTANKKITFAKLLWSVTLAREKYSKRSKARTARNRGMIVLMDRYPQNQVPGINDGTLLTIWHGSSSKIKRWISKWEKQIYDEIHEKPPDIIIKLNTPIQVAKKRKPETPDHKLSKKFETVNILEYDGCEMIEIDTDQDIETVTKQIKSEIWNRI